MECSCPYTLLYTLFDICIQPLSQNVKSCLKTKVRKETYEEVITRVFQERQRESALLLQVMLHGTSLTKFNSL